VRTLDTERIFSFVLYANEQSWTAADAGQLRFHLDGAEVEGDDGSTVAATTFFDVAPEPGTRTSPQLSVSHFPNKCFID
jgi:hypothetical protein